MNLLEGGEGRVGEEREGRGPGLGSSTIGQVLKYFKYS